MFALLYPDQVLEWSPESSQGVTVKGPLKFRQSVGDAQGDLVQDETEAQLFGNPDKAKMHENVGSTDNRLNVTLKTICQQLESTF